MKKLIAVLLCVSVSVLTLSGCAKKKTEATIEQAPADSTAAAVDTTQVAQ